MLSVPGAKTVRGYSMFGDSFVYILFDDGTDPYWARSRVLEYLNQVQSRLPAQAKASLGPDATGVGWVYEYALIDRTGNMDLSQLRALQDWFLKYELKTVPNVSEVASVGGMVRQYQIVLDPDRLRAYSIPQGKVIDAVQKANQETGGSVLELGEAEYMVRASGYLQSLDDFRQIPLMTTDAGVGGHQRNLAEVIERLEITGGTHHVLGFTQLQHRAAGLLIRFLHGVNHLALRDAVCAQPIRIEHDLILAHHAADARNFRNVGHRLQLVLQEPVLQRTQLRQIHVARAVDQRVLINPAHTGRVGAERRLGL